MLFNLNIEMSAPESTIKVHIEFEIPICAFIKFDADGFIANSVEFGLKNFVAVECFVVELLTV